MIIAIHSLRQPTQLGLYMMLWTGIRVGELCKLAWDDVITLQMPKGSLLVPAYAAKRGSERCVPIPVPLRGEILIAINSWYQPGQFSPANHLMARTKNSVALTTRHFQRAAEQVGKKALGHPINPHMFRHTYADRLRRVADLSVVQAALGHKNISTTAIYAHPTLDDLTKATNTLYGGTN